MSAASGAARRAGADRTGAPAVARWMAAAFGLLWAVLFFGIIDLIVVPIQDDLFYEHYVVETGWGLLYTVLVAVPLIVWAVCPRWLVLVQQVVAAGVAVLVLGLVALTVGQVFVGAVLAGAAVAFWLSSDRRLWPPADLGLRGANRALLAMAGLSAIAAVWYAWKTLDASHTGQPDDNTWGLMHLPMQAGFGVTVAASAALAVAAGAVDAAGWRFASLPSACSAVWLGIVCIVYPHHVASLGEVGGMAAVCWGLAFTLLVWFVGRRPGRRGGQGSSTATPAT